MDKTSNKTTESKLDELWKDVKEFRTSEHFLKVLEACKRFRNLAPYNSMLVEMQRPGARYVLTKQEWKKKFDRAIKPNARPIIVLVPFGPVDFLFDICDTYPTDLFKRTDEDILEELAAPFKTKREVSDEMLNNLTSQLAFHGIAIDNKFISGAGYGARIELLSDDYHPDIYIKINQRETLRRQANYLISANKNALNGERYANICHELGHLFCFHLPSPLNWKKWEERNISLNAKEFEAESVAWIVCERLGIDKPSIQYLNGYLDKNQEIPPYVSIERILSAAKDVLNMCEVNKTITYRDGLLYKNCEEFKNAVKKL